MKLYRSTSILQVILVGFSLVILPLIVALITALISVDRLTSQGQQAILASSEAIKFSRMLMEDLTAMERHARQYQVLKDASLYKVLAERHAEFQKNAREFLRSGTSPSQQREVEALLKRENAVFEALRRSRPGTEAGMRAVEQYPAIGGLTRSILAESSQSVGREMEDMQRDAANAQQLLIWQALAFIPMVIVLAAVFTIMIVRPIRQIDNAIRQLGDGDFSKAVVVTGPQDLVNLGERLDWLRQRLVELEQQKVTFLRHISHELKTPLAAIREGAGLLKDKVVGPLNKDQVEVAQILEQNSIQLQKLIEDLINFSIAQKAAPIFERRPVALDRLIEKLINNQKLAVKARKIMIDADMAKTTVMGDEEKLRIVFDNVLSNAIKYTPVGGAISVKLRTNTDHALIDIVDQGPGIDPDERERVFEAFYQGRAIAKGHVRGSGLGLSIAQEYVRSHAGDIRVLESPKGTHMHIRLPLAAAGTSA